MAINDFLYFSMEQMIEQMSQTGQGVAGKVSLEDADEDDEEEGEEGGEENDEQPDTKIVAVGMIFPILCHEIIKGLEEAKGRHGHSQNKSIRDKVRGAVDVLSNEPMQLRIGPEIVEKLRNALPDSMFDDSNKGLINWFHILLYQIEATEFLEIIGNAISDEKSKNKKATERFEEIMKEVHKNFSTDNIIRLDDAPNDTAKNFKINGFEGSFAIISTVTNPFCDTCNRLRLTANGQLKNCLFSDKESDLLSALRNKEDLEPIIKKAVIGKYAIRSGMDSNESFEDLQNHKKNRSMITIGG